MRCRSCDTEIDDNALICFRCGTAATDPVHQPLAEVSHRRRTLVPVVLGVVFVGVGSSSDVPQMAHRSPRSSGSCSALHVFCSRIVYALAEA